MTRNNPPVRSSFSISFSIILLVKEDFPIKEEGEERGKCHDPDTADLYQNQDDNMSDMRETGGYVDGG